MHQTVKNYNVRAMTLLSSSPFQSAFFCHGFRKDSCLPLYCILPW